MTSPPQAGERRCKDCGAVLKSDASSELCLRCALGNALEPSVVSATIVVEPPPTQEIASDRQPPQPGTTGVTRFGDYELLEEIARGGMGVVYKARQVSLDRTVAVKTILAGATASKEFIHRFRTEAAAAASLQHPNIVSIHEVGFAEGQHFFAMDYVEGHTLTDLVAQGLLPARQAAMYLKTIAEAIHFAHERNVLHRDLKPSNVLIDSATDQPRVTDFGLAKRLEAEADLTLSGQVLGSPNYMSPEQAMAKRGTVGKRSDVYSLGAILYHLLTGRPPFQGETLTDVLHQVVNNDPLAPHLLTPRLPRDLETICLKCLEKEPEKRYPTAQALEEELGRFLRDEPIVARPVSPTEKAWRWCRRKPVIASLAAGLVLAIAVGFGGVLWQLRRVQQEQLIVRRNLYTADMRVAQLAWAEGNLQQAQTLLREHLPKASREDLRGFEWRYLWNLCQDESRFTFTNVNFANAETTGRRHGLVLAADGRTVIAASGSTLRWIDVQDGREVQTMNAGTDPVWRVATALNRPGLLAYHADKIKAIAPSGETLLGSGVEHGDCMTIALSSDGGLLASGGSNYVNLWDVKTGAKIGDLQVGGILTLAFSPNAQYLVCGTSDTKIHILEIPGLKQINVLEGHTAFIFSLAFDPNGKVFASSGNDSHIILWSCPDGHEVARFTGHHGAVGDLAFSPDGQRLASGGADYTVRLWNRLPPGTHTILRGHRSGVSSVLFSDDGSELYTGSDDGEVKVWDVSSTESTNVLRHPLWLWDAAFSPDSRLLAVADHHACTAVLWDVQSRRRVRNVGKHSTSVAQVEFSPDGQLLASAGWAETVQVWNVMEDRMLFAFPTGGGRASLNFHPSAPILAVSSAELRFWDTRTGRPTNLLVNPPGGGVGVAFFPDGKSICLGMRDGSVSILDLQTGKESHAFHEQASGALCFSHDGTLLAATGKDNQIVLYDLSRRRKIKRFEGHTQEIRRLAFALDDKTLVSTSQDGTAKFWYVANQQLALTLAHDGGQVTSAAFSPDGNLMATSGSDGTVRLWPAPSFAEIEAAKKQSR
ncbi:MAG: protein kinase [Verrucomicrobiales bacterium]|nr:protein kinase [Verrucomicrobiales bacterium]